MADDTDIQTTPTADLELEEDDLLEEEVDEFDAALNKESLKPRLSREGKVFTNGFKIPGFNGYTDLPGKVCVDCGFNAMKFSKQCPKCGGELRPE